ncbi:MAG: hypothetical protein L0K27_05930 [Corynebacterium nuruki]|nr:hypothetical protein [Corynebacterium nuruki]
MSLSTRVLTAVGAVACGAALATGSAAAADDPAPAPDPQPVPVYQIPATALTVSGLVVPGIHFATVTATSTAPGEVGISAPTSPEVCATTYVNKNVRVDYVSPATGAIGNVTVDPCPDSGFDTAPATAVATPGSGPLLMSVSVVTVGDGPFADLPALPGAGTFVVP